MPTKIIVKNVKFENWDSNINKIIKIYHPIDYFAFAVYI